MSKFGKLLAGAAMVATLSGCQTTKMEFESFQQDNFASSSLHNYLDFKKGELEGYVSAINAPTGMELGGLDSNVLSNLDDVVTSEEVRIIDSPFSVKERQKLVIIPDTYSVGTYQEVIREALELQLSEGEELVGLNVGDDPLFQRIASRVGDDTEIRADGGAHVWPNSSGFSIKKADGTVHEHTLTAIFMPVEMKPALERKKEGLSQLPAPMKDELGWKMKSEIRTLMADAQIDLGKVAAVSPEKRKKVSRVSTLLHEMAHTFGLENSASKTGEVAFKNIYRANSEQRSGSTEVDTTLHDWKMGEYLSMREKGEATMLTAAISGVDVMYDEAVADSFSLLRISGALTDDEWEYEKAELINMRSSEPALVSYMNEKGFDASQDLVSHYTLPVVMPLMSAIDAHRENPNPRLQSVMDNSTKSILFAVNAVDMAFSLEGRTINDAKTPQEAYEIMDSLKDELEGILTSPTGLEALLDQVDASIPEGVELGAKQSNELESDFGDLSFDSIIANDGLSHNVPEVSQAPEESVSLESDSIDGEVMGIQSESVGLFDNSINERVEKQNAEPEGVSVKNDNKMKFN